MSVVIVSSIVLDPGSTPGISTILKMTTRLSRVILWADGFSFSPCFQRFSAVLTSFRNLSPEEEHCHSRIGYVTLEQMRQGLADGIIASLADLRLKHP